MHLLSYIILNNITQIKISEALNYTFESHKYLDNNKPSLFYGLYTYDDYKLFNNHIGDKWILWCGNDFDITNESRLTLIKSLNNIKMNLYFDEKLISNFKNLKFRCVKVDTKPINLSIFLKYIKYDTFQDFNLSFYSESEEIICLLKHFNNLKYKHFDKADFLISYKSDNIVNKSYFLKNNKIHFTNSNNCNSQNDVYYTNYKELLVKLYYFGINKEQSEKILHENITEDKVNTVTFIPVWNRHQLLIQSINSVKEQTEKCKILTVCSNINDYEYTKSLDIASILTINLPLGKKYQLGFEFAKLFNPKNVIILGSDDILSNNYIENINKYINQYDIVGLRNWQIYEIHENKRYELEYCHKIMSFEGKNYWGKVNKNISKIFNSELSGFSAEILKTFPFSIGAGRSLGYKILDKLNWQIYPNAKKMLDTLSLFNLLILNKSTYITLKNNDFYITSLKDTNIDMITPKEKYLNSAHINVIEIN